jgi:hypothetical protein
MSAVHASSSVSVWRGLLAPMALIAAVVLAYANSLEAPFVFDDIDAITKNPTIRALDSGVLSPPDDLTVSGRPIVNLSLALNYALSGESVRSYHAINVVIHTLAAMCLLGLLRRTFGTFPLRNSLGEDARTLAFAAVLLWALHPLQTQSVTYVIQRAESLFSLFYLCTLYCFARVAGKAGESNTAAMRNGWLVLSVLSCALGMASKEVMVSAPLVVILYDRVFLAASFREIWSNRRWYYLTLAGTWLVLAVLVWGTGDRRFLGGSQPIRLCADARARDRPLSTAFTLAASAGF